MVSSYTATVVDEPIRGSLPHPGFYSLPGIEQARAIVRGAVPRSPLSRLVGLRVTQVGPGSATVTMPASPWLQQQDGTVDSKMLLEAALHLAALSGAPPASDIAAASLSVSHLRPCTLEGEQFVAQARVVHSGKNFTVADAELEDALGRGVAHATGTYQIAPMNPPPPELSGPLPAVDEPAYSVPDPLLRPPPDEVRLFEAMGKADGLSSRARSPR